MFRMKYKKAWLAVVAVGAISFTLPSMAEQTIKIGASAPKTGPLVGGSTVTYWPNVKLWVEQANARGGLQLKSQSRTDRI